MSKYFLSEKNVIAREDALLERIARHLMMHASFLPNIGLYHGKMGIVLFFAHYARNTGNTLYEDFAGELLDEVYEEIHSALPVDFESGLCGIGWGIEYLLQNGFMEGDADEALAELDANMMERDLRRITDYSMRTGLEGISCYVSKRINSPFRKHGKLPFDETYLNEWKNVASSISIPEEKVILDSMINTLPEGEDIGIWKLGLKNGCAGAGLKMMEK